MSSKAYKDAVEDVLANTKVKPTDFDQKAIMLLDFLEKKGGRAADALKFLKQAAEGVERDAILDKKKYVYALLRKFDEGAYKEMKAQNPSPLGKGAGRQQRPPLQDYLTQAGFFQQPTGASKTEAAHLNPKAPEFKPGQNWTGRPAGATPQYPQYQMYPMACYPGVAYQAQAYPYNPCYGQYMNPPCQSVGSSGHDKGECKPCAFYHTKGCTGGVNCKFCHMCGPGEAAKRNKETGKGGKAAPVEDEGANKTEVAKFESEKKDEKNDKSGEE